MCVLLAFAVTELQLLPCSNLPGTIRDSESAPWKATASSPVLKGFCCNCIAVFLISTISKMFSWIVLRYILSELDKKIELSIYKVLHQKCNDI